MSTAVRPISEQFSLQAESTPQTFEAANLVRWINYSPLELQFTTLTLDDEHPEESMNITMTSLGESNARPRINPCRELRHPIDSAYRLLYLGTWDTNRDGPLPEQLSFTNNTADPSIGCLLVLDETDDGSAVRIPIPSRGREPIAERLSDHPTFMPLVDDGVYGLDLAAGTVRWSISSSTPHNRGNRPRIGPYGESYCLVQTPEGLCNIDPLSGEILWERRDITGDCGLFVHESTGMIADATTCVLFDSTLCHYRRFDTATGAELSPGTLPTPCIPIRHRRSPVGRNLLYLTNPDHSTINGSTDKTAEAGLQVRLWDPATETLLIDDRLSAVNLIDEFATHRVAYLSEVGDLVVADTTTGEELLRLPIDPVVLAGADALRVFTDGEHWYVNLVPRGKSAAVSTATTSLHHERALSNVQPESVNVLGTLLAISFQTGEIQWQRDELDRTFLIPLSTQSVTANTAAAESVNANCLISIYRDSHGLKEDDPQVSVDLIHPISGCTIAARTGLDWQQVERLSLCPETGRLYLTGDMSTLSIDVAPARPPIQFALDESLAK